MRYTTSNNGYYEGSIEPDMSTVKVIYQPDSLRLVTEDDVLMITETLYAPQVRVGYTDFLVVKDVI